MTELLADCDHFIAGAALIGGISYFHTYAYDLLATNERIIAASCDAAIEAHRRRAAAEGHLPVSSSMVFESTDHWPSRRGRRAQGPAAAVVVRLPEAGRRVLRPGRLGPVPAAVHDRPAVQLRRHRRGPGARRRRGRLRQRQAGDEPRRARPRAEGAQGPGPAAHPRRRATRSGTTPTAATWRAGIVDVHGAPRRRCNDDFNLSTAGVDDRARARRGDLAQDQGRRRAAAATSATRPSSTTCRSACPHVDEGQARCSASRRPRRLDDMLDEVIPWIEQAIEDGTI